MADIAINPVTRRVQFTGNTGTGPFAFTFNILADEDIAVYKNTTLLTLTTHYSVTTNANGTGSITLVAGQALISSDVLTIIGGRDLSRTTDFVTAGDLLASSLNEQLDSLVIMTQQLDEKVGRTIKTNPGDVYTDLELPTKDNRKGTVLGFNATSGDPEVGPTIADVSSLASITADIATLADIEDGTDATDAIQTVAGISSNVTTVAGISSNVTTVAGNTSNINAVAADATDIGTVAGSISNVNTVAGIDSNITTVAGNTTNINTVAGNNSNITTVAGVSANVTTVAGISSDVTTVAGISSDVTTVAADGTDIGTVATNIADVNTVASNISTISAKVSKSGDTMTGDLTIQGNLTVSGTTITVDSATAQTIDLGDGDRMRFGDSNDAYIEWNGTYFDLRSTGRFDLLSSGNDLRLSTATNVGLIVNHTGGTPAVQLYNSGVERLATTSTGVDITGTLTSDGLTVDTDTLHVDAANNRVGIGTTSPSLELSVDGDIWQGNRSGVEIGRITNAAGWYDFGGSSNVNGAQMSHVGTLRFLTASTERLRIDSSGQVGIGTSSPSRQLHLASSVPAIRLEDTDVSGAYNEIVHLSNGELSFRVDHGNVQSSSALSFSIDAAERMRIDSSGNLLVANTTGASADTGHIFAPTGIAFHVRDGGIPLVVDRLTDDGDLQLFRKDGTTVGSISSSDSGQTLNLEGGGTSGVRINASNASGYIRFRTAGSEAMRIDSIGNVGIGTSSPTVNLEVANNDQENGATLAITNTYDGSGWNPNDVIGTLEFKVTEGSTTQKVRGAIEVIGTASAATYPAYNDMIFSLASTNGISEKMRITDDGLVGIGTTSPLTGLYSTVNHISGTSGGIILSSSASTFGIGSVAGVLQFYDSTNSSERMRIDSSGNLLVGVTSSSANMAGLELAANGQLYASTSSSSGHFFNRQSTDGAIVSFRKDGTTVGSISTHDTRLAIGSDDTYIMFDSGGSPAIWPSNGSASLDNTIDLGDASRRFKDLYLSGGVYLGGVGSSNLLDDYEEGTWTPVLGGTSTVSGQTYAIQEGWYRKIGSLVVASFFCDLTTAGTISGNAAILGLPFTSQSSNSNHRGHSSGFAFEGLGVSPNIIASTMLYNTTQARIGWNTSETASLSFSLTGSSIFVNGSSLQGTITYYTA